MPRISTVIAIGPACNSLAVSAVWDVSVRKDIVQLLEEDNKPKGIVKQDDIHVYARHIEGQEIRVPLWPKDAPPWCRQTLVLAG